MSPWIAGLSIAMLLVAGWVRAAGTAVTRVHRADALRDESENVKGAGVVAEILDERDAVTPAIGVVVSALLLLSAVMFTAVFVDGASAPGAILRSLMVGVVVLAVGDLIPRAIGRRRPRSVAYRSARLLALAVPLGAWANDLLPESEDEDEPESDALPEMEEQERELIDSVLEFSDTIVREVMTPRPDMVTITVTAPIDDLVRLASEEGFSRVPVTSNGDIVGMAMVKDLLTTLKEEDRPASVAEVMRSVDFVPETKHASVLLAEMRESHAHQVIVVDEYGDVVGLVTIEDLLEELVGEIADETDLEEQMVVASEEGWIVDARLSVDELEKVTGTGLPDEEADTVGGLVLGLAERVPEEGETFRYGSLVLTVIGMQGRRILRVLVSVDSRIEAM